MIGNTGICSYGTVRGEEGPSMRKGKEAYYMHGLISYKFENLRCMAKHNAEILQTSACRKSAVLLVFSVWFRMDRNGGDECRG